MSKATKIDDSAGFISFRDIREHHSGGKHDWTAHDVMERLRSKTAEGFFEQGDGVRVFNVPGHGGRFTPEMAKNNRGFADHDRKGNPSMAMELFNCCWLSDSDYLRFCGELAIKPMPSRRQAASAPKIKRGRRSGEKWAVADEPFFAEMAALLDSGEARSVAKAAKQTISRHADRKDAIGHGTIESKAKRLALSYPQWARNR